MVAGAVVTGVVVTGVVATDGDGVVTTGVTTEVVVVVAWCDCGAATLSVATELGCGVDARAVGLLLEEPRTQLAPTRRIAATAMAFQCSYMNPGTARTAPGTLERRLRSCESRCDVLRISSTMC
jgi:hypothetical protein